MKIYSEQMLVIFIVSEYENHMYGKLFRTFCYISMVRDRMMRRRKRQKRRGIQNCKNVWKKFFFYLLSVLSLIGQSSFNKTLKLIFLRRGCNVNVNVNVPHRSLSKCNFHGCLRHKFQFEYQEMPTLNLVPE